MTLNKTIEEITKESLVERGFKRVGMRVMMKHTGSGTSIIVNYEDLHVELENCNDIMAVPNCKSLKDLDNFIYLFD